jgi:heme oxygenase
MNKAKEHVIVVLINFKELVETSNLKTEAKNRYENNIISSNINLSPDNAGPLAVRHGL